MAMAPALGDCRYAAERLLGLLEAVDEATERTSDLHGRLGADGVYAMQSELLPHAIGMARALIADLRQLEILDGGRT